MILEKYFLSFTLFYLLLTGTQGKSLSTYNTHYEQHEQSVQAGRKSLEQRLGTSISSHPSSAYVDCTLCSSAHQNHDYSTGQIYGGTHGSSNAHLSAHTSSHSSDLERSSSFQGHGRNYALELDSGIHHSHGNLIEPLPTFDRIITRPSGSSESYRHHSEKHVQIEGSPVIVAPSGISQNYHHESQRIMKAEATPIIVAPSGMSQNYHHESQRIMKAEATPIIVAPSGMSQNYHHESQRIMKAEATPIMVAPSGTSESFHHESQKIVQAQTPVIVRTPNLDTHFSTADYDLHVNNPSIERKFPSSGSYSTEYNSKYIKNNQVSPIITYTPSHSHSSSLSSETRTTANLSPINLGGLSTSSGYSTGGHSTSTLDLGTHHSSLDNYMSESERLARLQAHNIHNDGVRTGGAVLNGDYGTNSFSTSASGNLGGGYVKSKSWEKSSRWASGSEYGPDGRPKSYGLLSTAEAEQHNLNGRQAGYKAATTTLEDNGKVSTYTIHTP